MDRWRTEFAQHRKATELADVMDGADSLCSAVQAGALQPDMLEAHGENPIVLALSNPIPEIMPELAQATRPDSIICTGRSDYPRPGQQRALLPSCSVARSIAARVRSTSR